MITFLDFLNEAVASTKSIASKQDIQNINIAYKDDIKLKTNLDTLTSAFDRRYNKYVSGSDTSVIEAISSLSDLLMDAHSYSEKLLNALSKANTMVEKAVSNTQKEPDKAFWDEYNKILKFLSEKKAFELIWDDLKPKEFGDYLNTFEKSLSTFEKKYANILNAPTMKNSWTAQKTDIQKELERQKIDVEPLKALVKAVKLGDKVEKAIPAIVKVINAFPKYFKHETEESLRSSYEKHKSFNVGSGRVVLISFNNGKVAFIG